MTSYVRSLTNTPTSAHPPRLPHSSRQFCYRVSLLFRHAYVPHRDGLLPATTVNMEANSETQGYSWSNLAAWVVILLAAVKWSATAMWGPWEHDSHQSLEFGSHFVYELCRSMDPFLASILTGFVTTALMGVMIYFNCLDVGKTEDSQILSSPNFQKFTSSQDYSRPKGLAYWCLAITYIGSAGATWLSLTT